MMLSLLKKYQLVLSLLKVDTLTREKLQSVMSLAGYKLDPALIDIGLDLLKGRAEELGTNSVLGVLKDEETQKEVMNIVENIAVEKIEKSVSSEPDNQTDKAINWNEYVHKDCLLKCPHCSGLVHIRSNINSSN